MPFFIDDFWQSEHIAEMSDGETMLYLWCLGRQWQSGSIPADPTALKRLVPARFAQSFEVHWPAVSTRFECGADARLRNARCAEELSKANLRMVKASEAGRIGGKARAKVAALAKAVQRPLSDRSAIVQRSLNSGHGPGPGQNLPPTAGEGKPRAKAKRAPAPEPIPTNPDHAPLRTHFVAEYEARYGQKYPFAGGHDAKRITTILERTDLETAKRAISAGMRDEWWAAKGLDLKAILENLGKLAALAKTATLPGLASGASRERPTENFLREAAMLYAAGQPPPGDDSWKSRLNRIEESRKRLGMTVEEVKAQAARLPA